MKQKATRWADPARDGHPTVTTQGAAQRLGYKTQWIYRLAADGPDHDGIPAYLPTMREGEIVGWHRKEPGQQENLSTRKTMFYAQDLDIWAKAHPKKLKNRLHSKPVTYTEEERQQILQEIKPIVKNGTVASTELFDLIKEKYQSTTRNAHILKQARAVLLSAGIKIRKTRRTPQKKKA